MKTLVVFHLWHGPSHNDFSEESNVWYVNHYKAYFGRIYIVQLIGSPQTREFDNVTFVTLGTGNNKKDLFLAPFRLAAFVKRKKPDVLVTYEQVWLWWIALFIRVFHQRKIYLNPLTIPEVMYSMSGKSLSNTLPIWVEKILLKLSYATTNYVHTPSSYGTSVINWLKRDRLLKKKLIIASKIPESIPTLAFLDHVRKCEKEYPPNKTHVPFRLLYVGRLHKEKMVDHLIEMLEILRNSVLSFHLTIIGSGDELDFLKKLSVEKNVQDIVDFLEYVPNGLLPKYYFESDIFVSPLTGSSLREAGLCGVPIIAYKMDWVVDLLEDEVHYLAVKPCDFKDLARQVLRLATNGELRNNTAAQIKKLSWKLWSNEGVEDALTNLFSLSESRR